MKLHPLSIPYRIFQQGAGIAVALLVFGVPSLGGAFGLEGALATAGVVGLAVAAVVGYGIAYYQRYEYELTGDTFDIRSGVFARREREIPLRRIQNVDISQNVVQRALGIAEVRLETAGGSTSEAQLRYVSTSEAERLQTDISRLNRSTAEGEPAGEAERFETVFEITSRELGVLGLVSMDFRAASFLFLGASVFAPSAASMVDPSVIYGPETLIAAVLGPLAGLAVIVAFAFASGLLNAMRYYGFALRRGEEELRYERGLLQRFSGTIPLDKVQTLTITENVLARALGYASLNIETAGQAGGGDAGGSQSAIPIADRHRVESLATSIEAYEPDAFERPPKRARQRYAGRYAIALLVLAGVLYAAGQFVETQLYWYVPLAGLVLVPVAAHLKWTHLGYHLGENHVVTRAGFWVRSVKVVPYHRVQTVLSSETVFQRRRRLATVTVDTAGSYSLTGNDPRAVDVDTEVADAIRDDVCDRLYGSLAARRRAGEREPRFSDPGIDSPAD